MGTTYSIKVKVPDSTSEQAGLSEPALSLAIEKQLRELNQSMSTYIEDSELSRLNQENTDVWLPLSPLMAEVLGVSVSVFEQSQGAFDITVGPLVNAWGFGPENRDTVPSLDEIEAIRGNVGMQHLRLADGKMQKLAPISMDLSAVAKGFATDIVGRLLASYGFDDYMVEIGGELHIRGSNQRGATWVIGIEKPTFGHSGAMQALTGENIAIATSGDYRNYYEKDGKRVSHTIDPVTGSPIDHALVSVTVVVDAQKTEAAGAYADAYATALNVLGPEEAQAMAEREKLAVFFVIRDGESYRLSFTALFKQYMVN